MPKTSTKKTNTRGAAAAFVRTMPDAPASGVIAAAAKQGIKVGTSLVYSTRAYDRRTQGKNGAGRARGAGRGGRGRRRAGSGAEAQFKSLLVTIGVERARRAARRGRFVGERV
ncbi:MAG: hypothetical protein IPM35_08070 [Myxococcales bacterium]|nr:hypothetical protein [Myxococcales bacterium]